MKLIYFDAGNLLKKKELEQLAKSAGYDFVPVAAMQTGGAGKGSEVLWGASWTSACQKLGRAEGGRADVRRRDEPD